MRAVLITKFLPEGMESSSIFRYEVARGEVTPTSKPGLISYLEDNPVNLGLGFKGLGLRVYGLGFSILNPKGTRHHRYLGPKAGAGYG